MRYFNFHPFFFPPPPSSVTQPLPHCGLTTHPPPPPLSTSQAVLRYFLRAQFIVGTATCNNGRL